MKTPLTSDPTSGLAYLPRFLHAGYVISDDGLYANDGTILNGHTRHDYGTGPDGCLLLTECTGIVAQFIPSITWAINMASLADDRVLGPRGRKADPDQAPGINKPPAHFSTKRLYNQGPKSGNGMKRPKIRGLKDQDEMACRRTPALSCRACRNGPGWNWRKSLEAKPKPANGQPIKQEDPLAVLP